MSTNYCYDFGVVTSACDDLYEAIEKAYEYMDMVMFEGKYFRTDMASYEIPASIMKRYDYALNFGLISSSESENEPKKS